jgi:hypothetical protein
MLSLSVDSCAFSTSIDTSEALHRRRPATSDATSVQRNDQSLAMYSVGLRRRKVAHSRSDASVLQRAMATRQRDQLRSAPSSCPALPHEFAATAEADDSDNSNNVNQQTAEDAERIKQLLSRHTKQPPLPGIDSHVNDVALTFGAITRRGCNPALASRPRTVPTQLATQPASPQIDTPIQLSWCAETDLDKVMTFLHHSTAIKDVSEGVSFPELSHAFRAVHRAEANAHFEAAGREAMSKVFVIYITRPHTRTAKVTSKVITCQRLLLL